ncbi:MAG: saccharopine dehydrogenase C-terminal domain-containing protein [Gemmatimonadales bacterium]|jgi:lysine 6-dehydrogenase
MSEFLVLGAGMMGAALAKDLIESDRGHTVRLADRSSAQLERAEGIVSSERLTTLELDITEERRSEAAFRDSGVVLGALPHSQSVAALAAAVRSGVHYVDLVGSGTQARLEHDEAARARGVCLISGMGVAPGISNVCVGRAVEALDETEAARIFVGGVPLDPQPPLYYRLVYAIESVLNAYDRPAVVKLDGRVQEVAPLSGLEAIAFSSPFDRMECFYTDGLNSLLHTMGGRVERELVEKTVRYPGHAQAIGILKTCGLFSREPIEVRGAKVTPRHVLENLLEKTLTGGDERDVTLLRVVVEGSKDGRAETHVFEMVDHYDTETRLTSMARTTCFPASVAAQLIAAGTIDRVGCLFPEDLFCDDLYQTLMSYLEERGVVVSHSVQRK